MLILNHLAPYHWAIAGAGIGALTIVLLLVANKRLGISTGFENLCSLVIKAPYFTRESVTSSHHWRLPLLLGLIGGGALSAQLGGGWTTTWDLGIFDTAIGWGKGGKLAWMFVGGVFIGMGTRMAGGCTSGHGIFGLSNFEKSGLVATCCFMATGIVTSNILYRLVLGY